VQVSFFSNANFDGLIHTEQSFDFE